MKTPTTYFYEDKPLFGLDIGHGILRVLQTDPSQPIPKLIGYGTATFDPEAVTDGVVTNPEVIAKTAKDLFDHHLIGDITTNRVAIALPMGHAFTRSMHVPDLNAAELAEAVKTEAEQYIPVATEDLYIDYSRSATTKDGSSELFIVAMPKRIVDSYIYLTEMLGLEVVLFETSMGASAQLFTRDKQSDVPGLLIDFGNESADITAYDNGLIVSGTVAAGGEHITDLIAKELKVTPQEAATIKARYGLSFSKKQTQIQTALDPLLALVTKEIRRTVRYYEERSADKAQIAQIVVMGGGANMPGIVDYLTSNLRLPVRAFDPSSYIDFGQFQPFAPGERMSFVTVAGLSTIQPSRIFA